MALDAVAIVGFCSWIYCTVGFLHYNYAASTERAAATRAERANADLQDALNELRDELALAKVRIDTTGGEPKPTIAASVDKTDRVGQFTRTLESLDLQLTDQRPATSSAKLSWAATTLPDGRLQKTWARISLDQTEKTIQQLSAEYDAVVGERDQLRERVSELEQKLSLLQPRQAPHQDAKLPSDDTSGTSSVSGGIASIPFIGSAAVGPTAEQLGQGFKNFTPPGSVPDYFSNESGAILGHPSPTSGREQR
jgi:hypothetical protein